MSTLQLKKSEWTSLSVDEAKDLGKNILSDVSPKVTPLSDEPVVIEIERHYGEHLMKFLTDDLNILRHVDFWGAPFSLTYDIGHPEVMDKICISAYKHTDGGGGNYALNDFEVYASNREEDLYNEENLVAKYYRAPDEPFKINGDVGADNIFDVSGEARYLGLKILSPCPQDEIARIKRVAVFSDFNNTKFSLKDRLHVSDCLGSLVPTICGEYKGCPENLTNGIALVDEQTVEAKSDIEIQFVSDTPINANELYILAKDLEVSSVSSNGDNVPFECSSEDSFSGRKLYKLTFPQFSADSLSVSVKKGAVLDTLFSNTDKRVASVDFSSVISPDYIGAGCDAFPTAFTDYGVREGYNEVYWELEKHHMQKSKPHCIRMWFQIDWVVQTLEQYKNGDWQFDNTNMNSVVKYCEAFRENGIEVELNFGWKVGSAVQDWFAIGGIDEAQKECSAPRDPFNYAKAAVATLEYLILEKGCDNVKYLTFYNEIALFSGEDHYDFAMYGESVAYWASIAKYTKYFLDRSRIAGMVELWAVEQSGNIPQLMDRANILMPEVFARHAVHHYNLSFDEMCDWCDELQSHSEGKPIIITEFGNSNRKTVNWSTNHANNVLAAANHGVSGAFIWVLAGAPLVDPLNWMHAGPNSDESYQHWTFFPIAETLEDAGESFYELCLLNQYIPKHAKSVLANPDYIYKDTRFNAFCKDGEYTVVVECQGEIETKIEINLGRTINRTFYRHTYRPTSKGEGNLIIPATDKVLEVTDKIEDTASEGHQLIVYTTVKPVRQVIMDSVDIRVPAGSRVKIGATVLDDDLGQSVSYSISKSLIKGAKLENTEVVIPETAKAGEMLSVKAELTTGEYGISIIRVI